MKSPAADLLDVIHADILRTRHCINLHAEGMLDDDAMRFINALWYWEGSIIRRRHRHADLEVHIAQLACQRADLIDRYGPIEDSDDPWDPTVLAATHHMHNALLQLERLRERCEL